MAKDKALSEVTPAAEVCPPEFNHAEEYVALSPAMAKLRYEVLLRRGARWDVAHWLPHRTL